MKQAVAGGSACGASSPVSERPVPPNRRLHGCTTQTRWGCCRHHPCRADWGTPPILHQQPAVIIKLSSVPFLPTCPRLRSPLLLFHLTLFPTTSHSFIALARLGLLLFVSPRASRRFPTGLFLTIYPLVGDLPQGPISAGHPPCIRIRYHQLQYCFALLGPPD